MSGTCIRRMLLVHVRYSHTPVSRSRSRARKPSICAYSAANYEYSAASYGCSAANYGCDTAIYGCSAAVYGCSANVEGGRAASAMLACIAYSRTQ
eukprot:849207-Rhodomonas_salina.1